MAILLTHYSHFGFTSSQHQTLSFCLCVSVFAMAITLHSLAFASPVSHCWHQHQPRSLSVCTHPSLANLYTLTRPRLAPLRTNSLISGRITMMVKPTIQFIQGTDELTVPDVKLTKSRDGTNGMAIFSFDQPSVFDSSNEIGDITGFYMIDEEGVLQSVDASVDRFIGLMQIP
ncbi:hypothetical protein Patl1_01691 [Pistacia atlantica]|uniref:Uncharacterized protein n=1 Tax=Pistacia atlantica TaxID=434234 RepID=A0ACC1C8Z1_9ROSI|nr:hypothetical protein Patl1_01691 [Pistacia atlantica]